MPPSGIVGRDPVRAMARIEALAATALQGKDVQVHGVYVAQRIDVLRFEGLELGTTPLVVEAGDGGLAVIFRYGVVVFVGLSPVEQASFLTSLEPLAREPLSEPISDTLTVRVQEGVHDQIRGGMVVCPQLDIERIQVIAVALATSVALIYHEDAVSSAFDEVEPLAVGLERYGRTPRSAKKLARRIGATLRVLTLTVGRVEATEKPEVLWEHPELDPLFARLEDELELHERHRALERKLGVMSDAARALLDLRLHAQSLRVEWYIVLLILIEIIISIYALFIAPLH